MSKLFWLELGGALLFIGLIVALQVLEGRFG